MKKNFTLIEVMITIVIIGALATLGIPTYNNLLENSKAKVCEINLGVLLGALDIYALEEDSLPASLGYLKNEHIEKAWAKILQKQGAWKIKLAKFIVNFDKRNMAHAWVEKYLDNLAQFTCPTDTNGIPSYGLNEALAPGGVGITYTAYKALAGNTLVIADSDAVTFADPLKRHTKYSLGSKKTYGQVILKSGDVYEKIGGALKPKKKKKKGQNKNKASSSLTPKKHSLL